MEQIQIKDIFLKILSGYICDLQKESLQLFVLKGQYDVKSVFFSFTLSKRKR